MLEIKPIRPPARLLRCTVQAAFNGMRRCQDGRNGEVKRAKWERKKCLCIVWYFAGGDDSHSGSSLNIRHAYRRNRIYFYGILHHFCMKYSCFRLDFPGDLYVVVVDCCCYCACQTPIVRTRVSHETPECQRWVCRRQSTVGQKENREMERNFHKWKFLLRSKYLCSTDVNMDVEMTPAVDVAAAADDDDDDKCSANRWIIIIDGMLSHSVIFMQQQMSTHTQTGMA